MCVLFYFILFYFQNTNILTRLPSNLSAVPGLRFTVFPVVIHPGIGATISSFVHIIIYFFTSRGLLYTALLAGICITVVLLLHFCFIVVFWCHPVLWLLNLPFLDTNKT